MDLKFILKQLRDQRQSLDKTIHTLEAVIRDLELSPPEASTPEPAESSNERPRGLICRWCRSSFISERWSPVCKSPECRAKEAALKDARKSGRTPHGKKSGAADAQ
jgi:hypothetical protein